MKSCFQCNTEAPDDAVLCAECGRMFGTSSASGGGPSAAGAARSVKRPTGEAFIIAAWFLLLIGAGCVVFGVLASDVTRGEYGLAEPKLNTWKWPLTLLGGGLFNLGLLLWSVGQIQRAIYFLPGEDKKNIDL